MSEEQITQVFHGNVGQVAAGDIVNPPNRPYIDPDYTRQCPECHNDNQRHAERCWVCGLDFEAYDARVRQSRTVKRTIVTAAIGLSCLWGAQYLPAGVIAWSVMGFGALLVVSAIEVTRNL